MLSELYIENIAVIHKAVIRLEAGLNVFTGETGAGKTILISAIDAVLGERTFKDIIRTGEDRAVVSALFTNIGEKAADKLRQMGFEPEDDSVLITRDISLAAKSSGRINGQPATMSMLKEIASMMINIHGQHDNQQLLSSDSHRGFIDNFGGLERLLSRYQTAYEEMRGIRAALSNINMDEAQKAHRIDLLSYQIMEIEEAALEPGEEEALLSRRDLIRNSEKVISALARSLQALDGGEDADGLLELMDQLSAGISVAGQYLPELASAAVRIEEMGLELQEYASDIRRQVDGMEYDPKELDRMEGRLDTLYRLKKKYGEDIPAILRYLENAREELEGITMAEERALELEARLKEQTEITLSLAAELTEKRLESGKAFIVRVEEELAYLDMPSVKLKLSRREKDLSWDGADDLEFLISTNLGEEPKPLSKIASGGEISRIMLAVKNVLSDRDELDTLIFDEVDSGVSGRAAQKIGRKLKEVSRSRQVLCVTHLAQVAAYADHHLLIQKDVQEGRTFTNIYSLNLEQRVSELARIIGGETVSQLTLQSARELIENAEFSLIN